MKQNEIVKIALITALLAGCVIPFGGYIVFIILFCFQAASGQLKSLFSLIKKEIPILFFLFYIIISFFRSNYKSDSMLAVLGIFLVIFIYLTIRIYINSINDTKDIFKIFVIGNIIIATYGIIQFYFIKTSYFASSWVDSNVYNISMRAYSSLLNPNVLAAYLTFCICIQLTSLENIKHRRINIVALILSSFCLILTYSRGAWISLLIIGFLIYAYRKKIIYILYSFAFLIAIPLINGGSGIERMSLNKSLQDHSLRYRLEIYKSVIKIIKEHFFFGTGLNTMKYYINDYSTVINSPVDHAHNLILNILGETGLVGLIFFGIILITLIKNLYYIYIVEDYIYKDISVSSFLGFLSIFIHGLIDAPIIAPQFLFFVIYIYAFIINIKDIRASLIKSLQFYPNSRNNSGGESYETRDTGLKKSYFRT